MSRPGSAHYSGSHIPLIRPDVRVGEGISRSMSLPKRVAISESVSVDTSERELSENKTIHEMIKHPYWDIVASDTSRGGAILSDGVADTLSVDGRMRERYGGLWAANVRRSRQMESKSSLRA